MVTRSGVLMMDRPELPTVKAWCNWSGAHVHDFVRFESPGSIEQVSQAVQGCRRDGLTLRCAGSAHSFNPFWTDDVILSLDNMQGLLSVDPPNNTAKIQAGTKIHKLGPLLWSAGLSLPQQGDIDRQGLAGALSTGTHGTGITLPSMPNSIIGLTLVTAQGDTLVISETENSELLDYAKISMGMLGVIVDVTLKLKPAFYLHENNWQGDWSECVACRENLVASNKHFEFFWAPNTDIFSFKTLNRTDHVAQRMSSSEYIAPAYEVFPSDRPAKFNEMEYAVPYEQGWRCFCELRELFLRKFPRLPWPIEYRTMAADELPLSTAYQREVVTLSVHQGAERSYHEVFDAAETIFRKYGGRPHWGKVHSLKKNELSSMYPQYAAFCRVREHLDPQGVFINAFLAELFV